jgi:hypothetical protein
MDPSGSRRAALAWSSWMRAISSTSGVTQALSDMFWALKGLTRYPSSLKMRHRAAAMSDLPAPDMVPSTMSARARTACRHSASSLQAASSSSVAWCMSFPARRRHTVLATSWRCIQKQSLQLQTGVPSREGTRLPRRVSPQG